MQKFVLDAKRRNGDGRGASRRLRRENRVPAVLYGADGETLSLEIDANQLARQLENEAFYSHVLTLNVEGREEKAVLKALQHHPSERILLHADFQRTREDKPIAVHVPLHYLNEDRCVGVRQGGGAISKILTELEVTCLPRYLPEYIEIDIGELRLGETVHLGDLAMPEGVEIYALRHGGDPSQPVVQVHAPRVVAEPEEEAAEAAEAAEDKAEDKDAAEG